MNSPVLGYRQTGAYDQILGGVQNGLFWSRMASFWPMEMFLVCFSVFAGMKNPLQGCLGENMGWFIILWQFWR